MPLSWNTGGLGLIWQRQRWHVNSWVLVIVSDCLECEIRDPGPGLKNAICANNAPAMKTNGKYLFVGGESQLEKNPRTMKHVACPGSPSNQPRVIDS